MGDIEVSPVAHVIQLAVAPVFLLSGIGAMLAVMTSRLGRIIDRARVLEAKLEDATEDRVPSLEADLESLVRRANLIGPAITLCTATALLVCTVIAVLFLSAFLHFDASLTVALLFIAAMSAFFLGLLWFLREILVATSSLRIATRRASARKGAILLAVLVQASWLGAQTRVTLPKGVKSVAFGTAHRYFGPGKEMCVITYPMPGAVFDAGITELSYAVELEAKTVKQASVQVVGDSPQRLQSVPCHVFTPIRGGFSQTQIGNTISRIDKAPLAPGQYRLRIVVDGQTVEVPFSIKKG
jgi:hypothetical protein